MQVELIYTNETGEYIWAVQIYQTDEWLCSFKTFPEAEKYCKDNGYEIKLWGKRGMDNN